MTGKSVLYLLSWWEYSDRYPIAVYASEDAAKAESERLEAAYRATEPAWTEWCAKRSQIIWGWLNEGRTMKTIGLPTDEQEAEIISRIGPRPEVRGHKSCNIDEVQNRIIETVR